MRRRTLFEVLRFQGKRVCLLEQCASQNGYIQERLVAVLTQVVLARMFHGSRFMALLRQKR